MCEICKAIRMRVLRTILFIGGVLLSAEAGAQYAPQVGQPGSTAIKGTSSAFVAWASHCSVQRGYKDIAQPSLGYATLGDSSNAVGAMDGTLVSLGDSGVAVLTFNSPIMDGPGADFAVFENGFIDNADSNLAYLEFGFVEVSSDGVNYYRFPANSLTQDTLQVGNPDYLDARKVNNLAGKYIGGYGTPFDLSELSGISGLDINNVTHVRIIDVVGSIGAHASLDSVGRKINDPYPTPFASCGFDLDAVGVIHQSGTRVFGFENEHKVSVYPNPMVDVLTIETSPDLSKGEELQATVLSISGQKIFSGMVKDGKLVINTVGLRAGMYYLILQDTKGNKWVEKITKL